MSRKVAKTLEKFENLISEIYNRMMIEKSTNEEFDFYEFYINNVEPIFHSVKFVFDFYDDRLHYDSIIYEFDGGRIVMCGDYYEIEIFDGSRYVIIRNVKKEVEEFLKILNEYFEEIVYRYENI